MENNTNTEKTVIVYSLEGIEGRSRAKLKKHGHVKEVDVCDTKIKTFKITDEILGDVLACNFPLEYLVSTRKLPMLCVNIYYSSNLTRNELLSFFLNFIIDDNEDAKSLRDLEKKKLRGKYQVELQIDGHSELLDKKIKKFSNAKQVAFMMESIAKTDEIKSMLEDMVLELEQNKANKIKNDIRQFEKPENYINVDDLLDDDE